MPDCNVSRGVDVSFINEHVDRSGHQRTVTLHDHAAVDSGGAHFDGDGDYITIEAFDYASDSSFSVAFWMTKEECARDVDGNHHTYEYLYSHNKDSHEDVLQTDSANIYLACEQAGGGWSTSAGTVVRFLLVDSQLKRGSLDYPLHEAGNFDSITNRWVHIVLGVDSRRVRTFSDGSLVDDSEYGFFVGDRVSGNIAYPHPGTLTQSLSGFDLAAPIHLGHRSDGAADRHFKGRLAGLLVGPNSFSRAEVSCLFRESEEYLPVLLSNNIESRCARPPHFLCSVSLLDSLEDTSQAGHRVQSHPRHLVAFNGAEFDGDGDYISISNFEYASDTTFTISLWATKNQCTGGLYEYLYSHQHDADPNTWEHNAYALIMFACEGTHGGSSSTLGGGSFIRYDLQDDNAQRATFDFSLHNSGDFDAITDTWLHVILSVTPTGIKTFEDGSLVPDTEYGFFTGLVPSLNVARETPGVLSQRLATLTLETDIFLGGRADLHPERHFQGRIAMVSVYSRALTATEADCLFHAGDDVLGLL